MIIANLTVELETEEDETSYYDDKYFVVLKLGHYPILRESVVAHTYYTQSDETLLELVADKLRERLEGGFVRS